MSIPTCAVTCTFTDVNDAPVAQAEVVARLSKAEIYLGVVVPLKVKGTTDDNGVVVLDLWPNELGGAGTHYTISLHVDGLNVAEVKCYIPKDTPAVNLEDHIIDRDFNPPPVVIVGPPGPPGVTPGQAALIGKAVTSAGLRMAIIGASTEERANPRWNVPAANYQRVAGVATVTMQFALADQFFLPGMRIRLACGNRPDVEGTFAVVSSSTSAGVSTTITYADARPDVVAGTLGGSAEVIDVAAWTVAGGWPMHLNLALGARLDISVIATGGTNIVTDWGAERVAQLEAAGPFDVVLIGAGILGNAIKAYGAAPSAAYQALCDLIEAIRDMEDWAPRLVLVEELPATRDLQPTDPTYTAGLRLNRRLWSDLPKTYTFVRVLPGADAMVQSWSPADSAPSTDVLNGWPEANMLASDGIHPAFAWSWVRGLAIAEYVAAFAADWPVPEMGMLPDSRLVNTPADADGAKNGNLLAGLWGNVAAGQVTMTNPGCSGVGPAGSAMGFPSGRIGSSGSSTAVGSLRPAFTGGAEWVISIDGAGSTDGYTFVAEHSPAALLAALNDATAQGRWIDLWLPLSLQVPDVRILWASVELVATVAGQEYRLAAPQANAGQFSQGALARALDGGYSGLMRPPRFFLPVATYTAAALRVTVKEIPGNVASGRTTLVWGPGQRLQVVG
jgi:hypothetical protein